MDPRFSKKSKTNSKAFSEFIRSQNLEEEFLKSSGMSSLDELAPDDSTNPIPSQEQVITKPVVSAAPVVPKEQEKKVADAKDHPNPTAASDILTPYIGIHLIYASRKKLSSYIPSSLMMDYIVHQINYNLVDNFYFKRSAPDYHPYILRLYFGVVFYIQCLRAGHDARALSFERHQFLIRFLDAYPAESLPIPGPLLPLFKTLCTSQPEIPSYGKVYPKLPELIGPTRRDSFVRNSMAAFMLPNVPGIFALLEDLNSLINADQPRYPKKGAHIPVTADATQAIIFGHHSFPVPAQRTNLDSWSLNSSGLQYPCEADARLNEAFAERYSNFDFPTTAADDRIIDLSFFLSLEDNVAWFSQVKNIAAAAAAYFEGSGTLADCAPSGITANQIRVQYRAPHTAVQPPRRSADSRALFPFGFRLVSSCRSPPALSEAMASMAQTNVIMFADHPLLGTFGTATISGAFWEIRPEEHSAVNTSSYLSVSDIVKRMMKSKM